MRRPHQWIISDYLGPSGASSTRAVMYSDSPLRAVRTNSGDWLSGSIGRGAHRARVPGSPEQSALGTAILLLTREEGLVTSYELYGVCTTRDVL
jgi:hypothetical protein